MFPNVEVIEADILSIDFDSLFGPKPGLGRPGIQLKPEPVKVIGNLPYYITSDILLRLFDYSKYFESIVILVQREVADRVAAKPGTSNYGLLSATTQLYARVENSSPCRPERLRHRRRCIPPRCGSRWRRGERNWASTATAASQMDKIEDGFIDFLKLSFGQKRKTLWNNLKAAYPERHLRAALAEARVKPAARAETLSLEESAALFLALRDNHNGS
jgi:16S rRNA (adenine1518-N6/adenine1519-N6)-dimethyltransferase